MNWPRVFCNLDNVLESPGSLIVFFHAQRTGGSAFRHILKEVYGIENVYAHQFVEDAKPWGKVTSDELQGYQAFAGHSNYNKDNFQNRCNFVSLVRDPVYRAFSLYVYCKTKKGHKLRDLANKLNGVDFYKKAQNIMFNYVSDTQCQRICGKSDYQYAIDVIEKTYSVVGCVDYYSDFIIAMSEIFGWRQIPKVERLEPDSVKYYSKITSDFKEIVLTLNKNDNKLYEYLYNNYFRHE